MYVCDREGPLRLSEICRLFRLPALSAVTVNLSCMCICITHLHCSESAVIRIFCMEVHAREKVGNYVKMTSLSTLMSVTPSELSLPLIVLHTAIIIIEYLFFL